MPASFSPSGASVLPKQHSSPETHSVQQVVDGMHTPRQSLYPAGAEEAHAGIKRCGRCTMWSVWGGG